MLILSMDLIVMLTSFAFNHVSNYELFLMPIATVIIIGFINIKLFRFYAIEANELAVKNKQHGKDDHRKNKPQHINNRSDACDQINCISELQPP